MELLGNSSQRNCSSLWETSLMQKSIKKTSFHAWFVSLYGVHKLILTLWIYCRFAATTQSKLPTFAWWVGNWNMIAYKPLQHGEVQLQGDMTVLLSMVKTILILSNFLVFSCSALVLPLGILHWSTGIGTLDNIGHQDIFNLQMTDRWTLFLQTLSSG